MLHKLNYRPLTKTRVSVQLSYINSIMIELKILLTVSWRVRHFLELSLSLHTEKLFSVNCKKFSKYTTDIVALFTFHHLLNVSHQLSALALTSHTTRTHIHNTQSHSFLCFSLTQAHTRISVLQTFPIQIELFYLFIRFTDVSVQYYLISYYNTANIIIATKTYTTFCKT